MMDRQIGKKTAKGTKKQKQTDKIFIDREFLFLESTAKPIKFHGSRKIRCQGRTAERQNDAEQNRPPPSPI